MLPGQSFAKSGIAEISAAAELKFGAIKQTFAHPTWPPYADLKTR
jgi:hypothetical protein